MAILTATGPSISDAAFLAENAGKWWVGVARKTAGRIDYGIRMSSPSELTGVWRDPDGTLWVSGADGRIHHSADPWGLDAGSWHVRELDASLTGITGVHGTCVLARGVRASDGVHVLRWFDGRKWNAIGGPGIEIAAMHLTSERRIWVGGTGVARWDGEGWEVLETPRVVAIHAPTDDRVVVVLADGQIARATPNGLEPFAQIERACAVAVWRDRIWVGAGRRGLWRLGGGEVVCVREDRHCVSLEAHPDSLMIGCSEIVSWTPDGSAFPGGLRGVVESLA